MSIPAMNKDSAYADEGDGPIRQDLREQISSALLDRADVVTADTVAIFPLAESTRSTLTTAGVWDIF